MEINNNLIAVLLVLAIVISFIGLAQISIFVRQGGLTGAATSGSGVANLTVQGLTSITMLRNITDFGSGQPLSGQALTITTDQDNSNTAGFDDGSEGNGTNYGGCTGTESTCAFPFVVKNIGNTNPKINISASKSASQFITCEGTCSQTPAFQFSAKDNETGSCISGLTTAWTDVPTATESTVCSQLNSSENNNEIRIHFLIGIPSNAKSQTFNNTITIKAI